MSENLIISPESASKSERYETLVPQIRYLVEGEGDLIANLANIMAVLKEAMGFFWVGVYFVKGEDLVLGPFQGPLACTRIAYGKGVCGLAWKEGKAIIVPDVNDFPGHIACSSLSKSEIVIPVFKDSRVIMILDADSEHLNTFDNIDEKYLNTIVRIIESLQTSNIPA
jgi:L-methionine (R)-S-oxide reductase